MPLTKEQYDQYIQDLNDTATPTQKGTQYPAAIQAFQAMSRRVTLEMEAGGHPFKVYLNIANHKEENAPLFINIHGGGWYVGHMNNDVYYAAWLAEQIGGVVVDVDYSTSDIAPFPTMYAQCMAAVDYAFANAEALGCDPKRISIGGYSAGGHLTASMIVGSIVSGKHYPFALDVLCYAPVDLSKKEKPAPANAQEAAWQKRGAAFEGLLLGGDESLYEDPTYNIVCAPDEVLKQFPTTLILMAGKCPFRFEDTAFGTRLVGLNVETTMHLYEGATHGFIPHFTEHWDEGADAMVRYIRSARLK